MLDLQPIRARLAAATPGPWVISPNSKPINAVPVAEVNTIFILPSTTVLSSSGKDADLIGNAPTDLTALIEEVVRLRKAMDHYCRITNDNEAYKSRVLNAIHKHRTECLLTGTIHERDTDLWDILDA